MRPFVLAAALLLPGLALAQGLPGDRAPHAYGVAQPRQAQSMGLRGMDTDGDGAVSRDEFMAAHQDADARFAAIDTDKDGSVSREEYLAANPANRDAMFRAMDSNGDGKLTREEIDARRTAMFESLDVDHDGRITAAEMRRGHGRTEMQQSELPR